MYTYVEQQGEIFIAHLIEMHETSREAVSCATFNYHNIMGSKEEKKIQKPFETS